MLSGRSEEGPRPHHQTFNRPVGKRIGEASPHYDEDVDKQSRYDLLQRLSSNGGNSYKNGYNSNRAIPQDLYMSDMTMGDDQVSAEIISRSAPSNLKSRSSGYGSIGRPTQDCVCRCGK